MRPVILTCAVTGNLTRPEQTPHLPITPRQIATACVEAAAAGAAIVHVHVRDPQTGMPSMALEHYAEVVERVRSASPELILNLTTGPGGRYVPDPDNPRRAAPETSLLPPLERVAHIAPLKPEIATLDLNTMNSGDMIVMNTRQNTRRMAGALLSANAKPEIEIFNAGDLVLARELLDALPFPDPPMFSFVLGVKYGWPAGIASIQLGLSMLPPNAVWTAFGVGRHSFPMVAQSVLLGGHARVGLEDNIYLAKGRLAPSNHALCLRARRIIEDLGHELADPATTRKLLGLAPAGSTPPSNAPREPTAAPDPRER